MVGERRGKYRLMFRTKAARRRRELLFMAGEAGGGRTGVDDFNGQS